MQKTQQKFQENSQQESKNNHWTFSKIRNRITHTNQHEDQIIRQIVQISPKKNEKGQKEGKNLQQTPKLTHKRTQSKDLTKRLKLKDYIRLNEISRQKRTQSTSSSKLRPNKTFDGERKLDSCTKFVPEIGFNKGQQQKKVEKKPLRPYEKQIELVKGQLLQTSQKAKEKFSKIIALIDETNNKFSGYNDLVFMFNIQEMLNDYILKGLQGIVTAFDEHFADNNENREHRIGSLSSSRQKQIENMSPAFRAQFMALQEIYLMGSSKKKGNVPLSNSRSIIQFDLNEYGSLSLSQANLQIKKKDKL